MRDLRSAGALGSYGILRSGSGPVCSAIAM